MQAWHRRTIFCRTLTNISGMFWIISQAATILATNSMEMQHWDVCGHPHLSEAVHCLFVSTSSHKQPSFSVDARNHLSAVFPGRWIGRGSPIPWPARSPDLNLSHYFLWEYLKSLVFETPVETNMELVARILAACDIIKNIPGIFVSERQNLVSRCHACIEVGDRQFEQLL